MRCRGHSGVALAEPAPAAPSNPWHCYQVREIAEGTFVSTEDDKVLGRVHIIGAGGTKATCQQHRQCVCWLNGRVAQDAAMPDLVVVDAGANS